MRKLEQIKTALRRLEGGVFEQLCDVYLHRRGFGPINQIGLAEGTDKVAQGTPDTYIPRPDGTYVFAEYTTQGTGLCAKFLEDLAKCFDQARTGVPVDRIREIVLCHNSRLKAAEHQALLNVCSAHGATLNVFGESQIALDLYQTYPSLARDYLGIEVDTGQILDLKEFVASYEHAALAAPLSTEFRFREKELERGLEALEEENLLLLTGPAGSGKSRLAVEVSRQFEIAHPGVKVLCVRNRGVDLWQDLRTYLSAPGSFLLYVDDADRVTQFDYALQLLLEQAPNRTLRIVATVRDYALAKVLDSARFLGGGVRVKLTGLTDEQIKKLVREDFKITNPVFLERIAGISKGNPRLAVMAAGVAKRHQSFNSITDASELYDEYFGSIRSDLEDFDDPIVVKVAGIMAFFRTVDRTNTQLMEAISEALEISTEEFWRTADRLHGLEVVDMYENQVVKIADQVLETYLFYLAVFKTGTISFAVLLEQFFPRFRHRVVGALNAVLSVFDSKGVASALRPHVEKAWRAREGEGDEAGLLELIDAFALLRPVDALLYARERIREMTPESYDPALLEFVATSKEIKRPSLLSILSAFRYCERTMALELILDYLEKRPAEVPGVLRILTERFGITHRSWEMEYEVERSVIDALWKRSRRGSDIYFSRLFLAVAEPLLYTHFQTTEMKGELSLSIIRFDVPPSPEFLDLRRHVWAHIFTLYDVPALRASVLDLLHKHSTSGYHVADATIVKQDAAQVLSFIRDRLDPCIYQHCAVVRAYTQLLADRSVEGGDEVRALFATGIGQLGDLLFDDWTALRELGHEEYRVLQEERWAKYTEHFTVRDYEEWFVQCGEIRAITAGGHDEFQFESGVRRALIVLAARDSELYCTVLGEYLRKGNGLKLGPYELINKLVEAAAPKRAYELLTAGEYEHKTSWLCGFFMALPPESVTREWLDHLYELYASAPARELLGDLTNLQKFQALDDRVVVNVTQILLEKAKTEPTIGNLLRELFRPDSMTQASALFANDIALLEKAYFAMCTVDLHADYKGDAFNTLLDMDESFGEKWIDWMFSRHEYLSSFNDSRDYSFLWSREDGLKVIEGILERVLVLERDRITFGTYATVFFGETSKHRKTDELVALKNRFIMEAIKRRYDEPEYLRYLFEIGRALSASQRVSMVAELLRHTTSFEVFAALELEPTSFSWSGSAVPMLQRRVEFFESLLPLLDGLELLQHKVYVQRRIDSLRAEIQAATIDDFLEDR